MCFNIVDRYYTIGGVVIKMFRQRLYKTIIIVLGFVVLFSLPADVSASSEEILRPNAQGYNFSGSISLVPGTGEEAWEDVDEVSPDGDTAYLWNSGKTTYRTGWFALPAHSASGTITNVTVKAVVGAQEAPSQASLKLGVYIGSTEYLGSAKTVAQSYVEYTESWTTNLNTSSTWTWTDIDNLEIGFSIRGVSPDLYRRTKVTQIWVVVDYVIPNIDNSPISYGFGVISVNSTPETGLTYFTVTNNTVLPISITISAIDFTGGNGWTLSDTATPGDDTAGLKAGLEGGNYTIIVKKTPAYNVLVSGLPKSATQKWGLKLYTPTLHSDGVPKATIVTLTAVLD